MCHTILNIIHNFLYEYYIVVYNIVECVEISEMIQIPKHKRPKAQKYNCQMHILAHIIKYVEICSEKTCIVLVLI